MSEASIPFSDPSQLLALFGANDCHLRQIRDAIGVDVTVRGDEIRILGSDERVKLGLQVLGELRSMVDHQGVLAERDVQQVLDGVRPSQQASERANPLVASASTTTPISEVVQASVSIPFPTTAPAPGELTLDESLTVGGGIPLFEKAKKIAPKTPGQIQYVKAIKDNDLVFCVGPAGSGKTYLAVAMALSALRQNQVRKIVLVRPAVEAGERLGFLPGDLMAKVNPYVRPLLDALSEMIDYEQVKRYMEKDIIEVVPLAFMRGRTLNNTFIILDEGQNTTITQMKMFLTRLGQGSRIVVTGDITQNDLPAHIESGLTDAIRRLAHVEGAVSVYLTGQDIVRHRLVREIVKAYDT